MEVTSPLGATVLVGEVMQGLRGEAGPQGANGGFYEHTQTTLSQVWTVQHNLHYKPAGLEVETDQGGDDPLVQHVSDDVLLLLFPIRATSGKSRHS